MGKKIRTSPKALNSSGYIKVTSERKYPHLRFLLDEAYEL